MGKLGRRDARFLRAGLGTAVGLLLLCTSVHAQSESPVAVAAVASGLVEVAGVPLGRELQAPVYRHVDDRGVVHFSDSPYRTGAPRGAEPPPPGMEVSFEPAATPPANDGFDHLITRMSRLYRVRPALVKAVVAAESNFDPEAISHAGAQGLMQLMPATAERMGVRNPFSPEQNVAGGVRYLRAMLERYDDLDHALAAYNAGPTAVDRYRGIPPYPETQAYVRRVLNYYRGYHGEFRR